MTRAQLIDRVARRSGVDRSKAEAVVREIFDTMSSALSDGKSIELRGLGSFTVRRYAPYRGRNPRDGSAVEVGEKLLPHFKVGRPFRRRIGIA
jgi:integration host factor subunit beta